jgi:hypothetical protein
MAVTAAYRTITRDEYFNLENGWSQHRTFGSAEALHWYAEREPDTDFRQFAAVDHPTRFILATREDFHWRN